MNISYSFTVPESLAVISLVALILFLAVWLLMLLDVFRKILARHRQKKRAVNTENTFNEKKR
ncbi:hypothetical protein ID436_003149 [Salmonella enterica]|uniref:LapA family protein n=2 Tax=Salmonella enterica TaxID=28901 RepID=A0A5V2QQW8_SALER|nr:hypothetical protein [Salmonella enterica]EAA8355825.1 hypothetical protein [Salmonella enterica subsp. enterica serovar Poona]EAA8398315.1 hypothetical protein [Salmonella enterica subsp. enterica serovar Oranienburg]EAA8716353.1 hypothetical protein [Salmonella enterica subsp. enterica serovar Pomona]EAM4335546.1 hypothetical protein [Salmonella enterica subsp. enterica serovar Minnesota]EAP4122345.1 hypothetical protein [Salmonella enterica subsp. enterica serovar Infantis]EAP4142804.1 